MVGGRWGNTQEAGLIPPAPAGNRNCKSEALKRPAADLATLRPCILGKQAFLAQSIPKRHPPYISILDLPELADFVSAEGACRQEDGKSFSLPC